MIKQIGIFFLGILVLVTAGCAVSRPVPESQNMIRFAIRNADGVHISGLRATSDERGIIIQGKAGRPWPYSFRGFYGHIDVEVSGPEGTVIHRISTPIEPKEIPRRGFHSARFTLRMDSTLQPGTTVRVTPHNAKAEYPAE